MASPTTPSITTAVIDSSPPSEAFFATVAHCLKNKRPVQIQGRSGKLYVVVGYTDEFMQLRPVEADAAGVRKTIPTPLPPNFWELTARRMR